MFFFCTEYSKSAADCQGYEKTRRYRTGTGAFWAELQFHHVVEVDDVHILRHIEAVAAAAAVDLVAAVVGAEAEERVVRFPVHFDERVHLSKAVAVGLRLGKGFDPLRTEFVDRFNANYVATAPSPSLRCVFKSVPNNATIPSNFALLLRRFWGANFNLMATILENQE